MDKMHMPIEDALKFFQQRYSINADYVNPYWEPSEAKGHEEYVQALKHAIDALQLQVPMRVTVENWEPNKCPNCGKEIDEHIEDGYYEHPEYERCYHCSQKLFY